VRPAKKVKPAPQADIEAILPHLNPVVRAMVQLQVLAGARPGEIRCMTTGQIDRSVDPWIYNPTHHKTERFGTERPIPLGPRAQQLAYKEVILEMYGEEVVPPRTGKPGRPRKPETAAPEGLRYATVPKTRKKGRVVSVATRVIFGTAAAVQAALANSTVSQVVKPSRHVRAPNTRSPSP
jgi:hypothetical protein